MNLTRRRSVPDFNITIQFIYGKDTFGQYLTSIKMILCKWSNNIYYPTIPINFIKKFMSLVKTWQRAYFLILTKKLNFFISWNWITSSVWIKYLHLDKKISSFRKLNSFILKNIRKKAMYFWADKPKSFNWFKNNVILLKI